MSDIIDTLTDGLLDREADTGSTFTWSTQTVPCSGGASKEGKSLDFGGFKFNADVVIVVRIGALDPTKGLPIQKNLVSYVSAPSAAARSLRIDSITTLYNALLVFECNDPNQAA